MMEICFRAQLSGDGEIVKGITENLKVVRNIPNEVLDKKKFDGGG